MRCLPPALSAPLVAAVALLLIGATSGPRTFGLQILRGLPRSELGPLPSLVDRAVVGLRVVDLDGDDDLDVAYRTLHRARLGWLESSGGTAPTFTDHLILEQPGLLLDPAGLAAADLDGDGHVDLAAASRTPQRITWFESDGGTTPTFTPHEIASDVAPDSVEAADLDGDDDVDLLVSGSGLGRWYENAAGDGSSWIAHDLGGSNAASLAVDLDGDGDIDLVGATAWRESNGASPPSFTVHGLPAPAAALPASGVTTGDVDSDGDLDVVGCAELSDTIVWYENLGGTPPSFTARVIQDDTDTGGSADEGFADGPVALAVGAIDADGDGDVLVAAARNGRVAWFENLGGGLAWGQRVVSTAAEGASIVRLADLDGNGHLDVVSGADLVEEVAWHPNRGSVATLPLTIDFLQAPDGFGDTYPSLAGVGVAEIQSLSGNLTQLELVAGHLGTATTPVATTGSGVFRQDAALTLGTGAFPAPPGGGFHGAGFLRLCVLGVLLPNCSANIELPLSRGGAALGVGGLLTTGAGSGSIIVSLRFAPWTVATVSARNQTVNGGFTTTVAAGFAHGPLSFTGSTTQAGGVLQLVSPIQIDTIGNPGADDVDGIVTRLTIHFVPEPGAAFLLGGGALLVVWLGRVRRRRRTDR